jgi:hypothetical protein
MKIGLLTCSRAQHLVEIGPFLALVLLSIISRLRCMNFIIDLVAVAAATAKTEPRLRSRCSRVAACHAEGQTKAGATLTSQKASLPGDVVSPGRGRSLYVLNHSKFPNLILRSNINPQTSTFR